MLEPHSLSHLCPLRSFLESLLRTTVWAPLIWSQNPSDLCISVYNILIVSWPLFECLPKRVFPFGDHSFGKSSFCYIKICSPIISTVGLGSTKGDNTEQMEPFFHRTAYYIIKDSPRVSHKLSIAGKTALYPRGSFRFLYHNGHSSPTEWSSLRLPVFLLEKGQELSPELLVWSASHKIRHAKHKNHSLNVLFPSIRAGLDHISLLATTVQCWLILHVESTKTPFSHVCLLRCVSTLTDLGIFISSWTQA